MGHTWEKDDVGGWVDHPLEAEMVALGQEGPIPLQVDEQLGCVSGPVLMRSLDSSNEERWLILCVPGSRARVNETPIPVGARLLKDRDAITFSGRHTVFFSSERLAQVEPYPGTTDDTCCIRCKLPLDPGAPVVRCPNPECGFFHHESVQHPCWTYADGCAACGHPTDLDAGFQWSPVDL